MATFEQQERGLLEVELNYSHMESSLVEVFSDLFVVTSLGIGLIQW